MAGIWRPYSTNPCPAKHLPATYQGRVNHSFTAGGAGWSGVNRFRAWGAVMSEALKLERNQDVAELQAEVARMADMVCEATRQAALDGIASSLSLAADRNLETPDR